MAIRGPSTPASLGRCALLFTSLALLCAASTATAGTFVVKDLGTLGGLSSRAEAVANGEVVGVAATANGIDHAFRWTPAGGMADLAVGPFVALQSWASAVSDGQVVGNFEANDGWGYGVRAFSWTQSGGMIGLGPLSAELSFTQAAAVSQGQVVGTACPWYSSSCRAFSWTAADGMVDLGTLGGTNSWAVAVDDGQVVGCADVPGDAHHAFSWSHTDGIVDIGTLGGSNSWASAVHNGQVVGYATTAGDDAWHAFSWTRAGGIIDLGTFGGHNSQAWAISEGQVVGNATFPGEAATHAFSWDAADGMVDLGTLGGSNSWATAVDHGQVVGYRQTAKGQMHAFSWTADDGMVDLGMLGGTESQAFAVSNGLVVGYASTNGDAARHAVLWMPPVCLIDAHCADNNLCTTDSCDRGNATADAFGCVHTSVVDGASCDDGLVCNGADTCAAGLCIHGPGVVCTPLDQCHVAGICDPGTGACSNPLVTCPAAGDQCQQAACNPTIGCTTEPKPDGTSCNTGSACATAACRGGTCAVTDLSPAGASCEDGRFCNGVDICDGSGVCAHTGDPCLGTQCNTCQEVTDSCFDPGDTVCNDKDPTTMNDTCTGGGVCAGTPGAVIGNYAVLTWPASSTATTMLARDDAISGHLCAYSVRMAQGIVVNGDVVATAERGGGVTGAFLGDHITQSLVTCGGSISMMGRSWGKVDERTEVWNGVLPMPDEVIDCEAAAAKAAARHHDFLGLAATSPSLGAVRVAVRGAAVITTGTGIAVIDATSLSLGAFSRLTVSGGASTDQVIIRVGGPLSAGNRSQIVLQGVKPEQVIFVVDGPVTLAANSIVNGSILGADAVQVRRNTTVNGQLLASKRIRLSQRSRVTRHSFSGW